MIHLTNKEKEVLVKIFEDSKNTLHPFADINEDNFRHFMRHKSDKISSVDHGVSKAVFLPTDFPDVVVKIPFTSGPEERYWLSRSRETDSGEYSCYDYEIVSDRFEQAWQSIPDSVGVEMNNDWNYCEVEEILFKEAVKHKVDKFFACTQCIGYVNDYPIYAQERCRVYNGCEERALTAEEKRRDMQYITKASETSALWYEFIEAYKEFCLDNKCYCYECMADMFPLLWMVDCYLYWGFEEIQKLFAFLYDYGIDDLHGENVGYINHIPVIIDYSSFNS